MYYATNTGMLPHHTTDTISLTFEPTSSPRARTTLALISGLSFGHRYENMDLTISLAFGSLFTPFSSFGDNAEAPGWKHGLENIFQGENYKSN